MIRLVVLFLAGLCLGLLSQPAAARSVEQFSVVANGAKVGTLTATGDGDRVNVDFHVDNNGRGPKHRQEIILGQGGIPASITVKGTSLMGGAVEESYGWDKGRAHWKSQADEGAVAALRPALYIVNDDNPYVLGLYARAALAAPGRALDVLPSGRIMLTELREMTVGSGAKTVPVRVYRLAGVRLAASYLLLDDQNRLFAVLGDGTTVRAGYEEAAADLEKLQTELENERIGALQRKLAHRIAGPLRIVNVRIFDPRSGKLSSPSSVVVMRDRITQVIANDNAPPPADETLIDGEGGTLYPGLHDMHTHAALESGLMYLAAGVTTTRDMGSDAAFMQDLLPRIASGEIAWPDIVPSGFIEGKSPYSSHTGFLPATLEEAKRDVRWYADRGYAEIKIYNSFNPDWVKPVADEAHRLGLRVAGHVPAFDTPDRVIRDGYDTIAHINQVMLGWILGPDEDTRTTIRLTGMARAGGLDLASPRVQETVRLMREHGTALDTTAVTVELLMTSRAREVPDFAKDYIAHLPAGDQRRRKRSYATIATPEDDAAYKSGFAKVIETLGMLHRAGIKLLPGTDDGNGFTLQRELELYVKAGMTPAEALRAATLGSAEYLGRAGDHGTIERGKYADFVLVAGDPTRDITAIKRPRMVMKGGAFYFPSEIYSALAILPFTEAPVIRPPAGTKP